MYDAPAGNPVSAFIATAYGAAEYAMPPLAPVRVPGLPNMDSRVYNYNNYEEMRISGKRILDLKVFYRVDYVTGGSVTQTYEQADHVCHLPDWNFWANAAPGTYMTFGSS
jgi:hypothetical protein